MCRCSVPFVIAPVLIVLVPAEHRLARSEHMSLLLLTDPCTHSANTERDLSGNSRAWPHQQSRQHRNNLLPRCWPRQAIKTQQPVQSVGTTRQRACAAAVKPNIVTLTWPPLRHACFSRTRHPPCQPMPCRLAQYRYSHWPLTYFRHSLSSPTSTHTSTHRDAHTPRCPQAAAGCCDSTKYPDRQNEAGRGLGTMTMEPEKRGMLIGKGCQTA